MTIDYYAASHDTTTRIVIPSGCCWRAQLFEAWSREPKGFACSVSAGLSMPPSWASWRFRWNRHGRRYRTRRCSTVTPSLPSATLRVAPSASWMLSTTYLGSY